MHVRGLRSFFLILVLVTVVTLSLVIVVTLSVYVALYDRYSWPNHPAVSNRQNPRYSHLELHEIRAG